MKLRPTLMTLAHLAIIILLGSLIYSNTMQVPFVFDDEEYVHNNVAIKDFRAFVDDNFAEQLMSKDLLNQNFRTRIVTFFTFAINYRFSGHSLMGYHLTNLGIHLLNGMLVYWLMRLTTQTPLWKATGGQGTPRIMTLFTALLFVCHPIQTQAVTYISQRFTSLATLFCLFSLASYIFWRQGNTGCEESTVKTPVIGYLGNRPLFYGLSLVSMILAMKTKEISFTMPLIVFMYEYFFLPADSRKQFLLLPFLLSMLIIPLTILGQKAHYYDIDFFVASADETGMGAMRTYLCTQFRVIITYLRLLFLPINQNLDYSYQLSPGFFQLPVVLSFIFLGVLIGFGLYLFKRSQRRNIQDASWLRLTAFGIFWFFLAVSVESSLLPLKDVIFEHRLYFPSVGFCLALTAVGEMAYARFPVLRGGIFLIVAECLILTWAGATYRRNIVWQDAFTLWSDTVQKSPDKYRPHLNLGNVYNERGRFQDAIREYTEVLKLDPTSIDALSHLAVIYLNLGNESAALTTMETAAKCKDAILIPRLYDSLGELYLKAGRLPEAETAFLRAIPLDENPENALSKLGEVYLMQKRFDEATQALEMALNLAPGNSAITSALKNARTAKDN